MDATSLALAAVLLAVAAAATRSDLRRRLIPNRVTGAGALLALGLGLTLDPPGEPRRVLAALAAATVLLAPALVDPEAMGMGDVKLAGVLGLCLGPAVAVALLVAFAAGGLYGLTIVVTRGLRAARGATLPFGPCLALGGAAGVVAMLL